MAAGPMDPLKRAPTLTTERLVLRDHRVTDLDACAAMRADAEVARFITGDPIGRGDTWRRLLSTAGHWALLGFGYWAVEERASGRFVGEVGLSDFKRDAAPSFEGAPEIGWVLARWSHGRGFATEAAHAALAWIDAVHRPPRTVCMIDEANAASVRIAEKLGYRRYGEADLGDCLVSLFERRPTPRD